VVVSPESSELPGDGLLLVGRVARAHGLRGHVIVNPETDFMEERFRIGRRVLVGAASRPREYEIEDVRFHQGRPVVRFAGVTTMNDAETLAGAELWLREAELEPLPAGTFYRHDLVGCEVRSKSGDVLGHVTAVEGSIDRSYLVVAEHMMIPLVAGICVAVDIANRRVTIDPPDGLIDLNRPAGSSR
jgi:16S rRNA processing protein RimM